MEAEGSKKRKVKESYKTASYYARAFVIGFLLWFVIIIAISFGPSLAYMGRPSEIIVALSLLAGCMVVGFYVNKWTAKYMLGNKL